MKTSIMAQETKQAPKVIAEQLRVNASTCRQLADILREMKPSLVYIIGRGSSDHAGVFAKYLIETELGLPVAAAAPSVSTIYQQQLNLKGALVVVISQSGRSPDILAQTKSAKKSGALCIALVNDLESPLANIVDYLLPLSAGEEKAIAATKSYLATLSALLQLVAYWKNDSNLKSALTNLPAQMEESINIPPQLTHAMLNHLDHCIVIGRGFGYAIAKEIALKLKEVCTIHAEAFSSAEFLHGPVTLIEKQLSIINIEIPDESQATHSLQVNELKHRKAKLLKLSPTKLIHPRLSTLLVLQRFYLDIEHIAVQMSLDPDSPSGLKKITETL